ncbi:hypothetical protein DFH07DRAFT_946852 [Mycena maculata]|uniref:DUF1776-domain-containing protein n=1 Tax=Mycena maculata TaxID=230809 RepID=A0AAD7MKC2_9AGAR|nr:hypothetical protein DFH07DRAFT_946852 [Mycena maculata]
MGTIEEIEGYLEDMFQSLERMPTLVAQLWQDITRYGPQIPSFPDVHVGGLGDFEIPPPPPPPPPASWIEQSTEWVQNNPKQTAGIVTGIVGTGLISYGAVYMRAAKARRLKEKSNERRQVVVVLGGDSPLALPLIIDLERKGYIVIASVSNPDFGANLERRCHGYVRALVLDPNEPTTVAVFLRSLSSALSRRFPITAAGDPFVSPSAHPYIHSVISLLSLTPPTIHAPLEHISLRSGYLPYLNATSIVPLQIIQALLPMLRTGPTRDRTKKSIIVCLPATTVRVGLPFSAMQSMSAVSTCRAVDVLRREVNIAALTDKSQAMKNIKVVTVDVGAFNIGQLDSFLPPTDVYRAMEGWSSSEKLTYGPSFASLSHAVAELPSKSAWSSAFSDSDAHAYGVPRKPTDSSVFVNNIVSVVSGGQFGSSVFGIGLGIGRLRHWIRGERFSIGAGASTYKLASFLPPLLLDTLINIPHFLISLRNSLLPVQPFVRLPPPLPPVRPAQAPLEAARTEEDESGNDVSETGSEADVESNSGDGVRAGGWVSLKNDGAEA